MQNTIPNICFQSAEDCKNRIVNHGGQMRHVKWNKDIHITAFSRTTAVEHRWPYLHGCYIRTSLYSSRMWQCVFTQVVPNISKALWPFAMLGLNDLEDEGTNILWNITNCSHDNTASHPTRMGLSATPEPQMSQLQTSHFGKELDQNIILE